MYKSGELTSKEHKIADLLQYIKAPNTFLTFDIGELKYTIRSTDYLKDLDDSSKRAQTTKKSAVVSLCYRMCKPSECAAAQELLIQIIGRDDLRLCPMIKTIKKQLQGVEEISKT